jgi:hypothetical protein
MNLEFESLSQEIERLENILRPEADREIDINNPNWQEELRKPSPSKKDPDTLRSIRTVTEQSIRLFLNSNSKVRSKIKHLLKENYGFTRSMEPFFSEFKEEQFKQRLTLLIMNDSIDSRDAIMRLESLISKAKTDKIKGLM